MNLDNVRLKVDLYDVRIGEIFCPALRYPVPVGEGAAHIGSIKYSHQYYIEGSPLTWFFGQNLCGPDVYPRLQEWADEVVQSKYPSLRCSIYDITSVEVFGLYRPSTKTTAASANTLHLVSVAGRLKYSCKKFTVFSGVSDNTIYSRPIEGCDKRYLLMRMYAKVLQTYVKNPASSLAYLDADDTLKLEFHLGSGLLNTYRHSLPVREPPVSGKMTPSYP